MKIAYFDCFSGISGDMVLGAFLDAGVELDALRNELKRLPLENYSIDAKRVQKGSIGATKVEIDSNEKGINRTWTEVRNLIEESRLTALQTDRCKEVFLKIATAEAKIHQQPLDDVHFHEVGAVDSIIDVVGAVICLSLLRIEEVHCSALPTGNGLKETDHGTIPIPAPATLEILGDVPMYSRDIPNELVTPTGAAIAKTFSKSFGPMPHLKIKKVGYGAGSQDLEAPNVLRLIIGESLAPDEYDEKVLIETNVDDQNPEFSSHVMEKLFESGAVDVWLTPIYMKKSRLGFNLSVLAPREKEADMLRLLFTETNTLGARISKETRRTAIRKEIKVKTKLGEARAKIGYWEGRAVTVSPEHDDCAELARNEDVPLKVVYEEVKKAAETHLGKHNNTT